MDKKPYGIGLDMGVGSVGWTIVDGNSKILRVKGKDAIGVRLFDEGETAAKTRTYRAARRRYKRRKWRLRMLDNFFYDEIIQKDPNFFQRLRYFSEHPDDPNRHGYASNLIAGMTDKRYHRLYPTIYHLRNALMTKHEPFDIRLVYLAIHHIVKYRGNFLMDGTADSFNVKNSNWEESFNRIKEQLLKINSNFTGFSGDFDKVRKIAFDHKKSSTDKKNEIVKELIENKQDKKILNNLINAILGNKTRFEELFGIDVSDEDRSKFNIYIKDWDDKVDEISSYLSKIPDAYDLINEIKKLHAEVQLSGIIPGNQSLSEKMISSYEKYGEQLNQLKAFSKANPEIGNKLMSAYDVYNSDGNIETFYTKVKRALKEREDNFPKKIIAAADPNHPKYLVKQRAATNSSIPYQIHQRELDEIIKNQTEFHKKLATPNPTSDSIRKKAFPYALDELVGFRVPYYVGPLVSSKESKFAWMERKNNSDNNEEITPWNFDEIVDRDKSAMNFIDRMKTTDSYLIDEEVIPENSLTYQKFTVLNELNRIRVMFNGNGENGELLTVNQKQRIFNQVFKSKKSVTDKDIIENLKINSEVPSDVVIKGLSDGKHFNSSLSAYIEFKKIIADKVDDHKYFNDIEQMITWSTTFEDNKIFKRQLNRIKWLDDNQRNIISNIRYRGWGRLSNKLLLEIKDSNDQSIMDHLWNSKNNFMQIVNSPEFKSQIIEINNKTLDRNRKIDGGLNDTIKDLFTSPQNKRSISQVMLVVKDIVKIMGYEPTWIFIEAARDNKKKGQKTISRAEQLATMVKEFSKDVKKEYEEKKDSGATFTDALMLYFQQDGRDIYGNSDKLDINRIDRYDIDHIIPQSLIKDDSLNNRVLTSKDNNEHVKKNQLAMDVFGKGMISHWKNLEARGLITKTKYNNLTMRRETFNQQANRFIGRQLVETRQVIKLVSDIISNQYPETKIINVKAKLSSDFRREFKFPKIRVVNDFHHAFDAYLAAMIGNYLMRRSKTWNQFVMYGDYPKDKVSLDRLNGINNYNIIGEFKKDKLVSKDTGEIIWDKQKQIKYLDQVFNWKCILVTHRLYTDNNRMFKETILKAGNKSPKPAFPIKKNKPLNLYGGYANGEISYYSIIRVLGRKKKTIKICKISTVIVDKLNKSVNKYKSLKKYISSFVKDEFEILIPKVYKEQSFIDYDGRYKRNYRIDGDYRSNQQFYMNKSMQLLLEKPLKRMKIYDDDKINDEKMNDIFDYICDQIINYFPMYHKKNYLDSLNNSKKIFYSLPIYSGNDKEEDKLKVVSKLLAGLHTDSDSENLKSIDLGDRFGRMQSGISQGPVVINDSTKIIYSSPTGLLNREVKLSNLKGK
ncbi:type II CRISPR RNA-guided endonuclease Cas9 [Lactobacillus sp. Sy-1]|uniref:type II CRISPR RNA-guided endonuclease Cas9 n=1 Tax=Lactobacillus sp. Sy-1 TaxID=2109645 RepID=UPI001C5BB570|nr:type II CRISPR RNA-guided endonuclease Cas9 [Lactobacillus sp. Sy-1]MBW1606363.1 type II CRISPR RNA-guided endonuclease Cas9 [Lactobacillus sp. Sy-1]